MVQQNLTKIVIYDPRGLQNLDGVFIERLSYEDLGKSKILIDELQDLCRDSIPKDKRLSVGELDSEYSVTQFIRDYDAVLWIPAPQHLLHFDKSFFFKKGKNWFEQIKDEGYNGKRILSLSAAFRSKNFKEVAQFNGLNYSDFSDEVLYYPSENYYTDIAKIIREM